MENQDCILAEIGYQRVELEKMLLKISVTLIYFLFIMGLHFMILKNVFIIRT